MQLILSSVYHVDSPTGNISLADAKSITNNRMVKNSTKLSFGDNFKGFKIVGAEKSFLELYNCKFENGRVWEKSLEAVVGKNAAEILNLKIGDEIKYNDSVIGRILIDKPYPFALIKLFDPDFSVFKDKKLKINDSNVEIIS